MSNAAKAVATTKTARKRNRKRKRRIASSSEPSESSSSGSEDERSTTVKPKSQVSAKPVVSAGSPSSSESSESESDSASPSDKESIHRQDDVEMVDASVVPPTKKSDKRERVLYSRSPSPVPPAVPSFLPTKPDGSVDTESERNLKDRFRKFWMQSVADAFQDDLAQIHKEPGMNKSRLAILVDSLASGADVFTSNSSSETSGLNEMDIVMGNLAR